MPCDGAAPAGVTTVEWNMRWSDGAQVAPGVYFARIQGAGESRTAKIVALGR